MQYYHEMSAIEIAEEMGKTPDNIRHISMRAKRKLQSLMKENGMWNEKPEKNRSTSGAIK